MKKKVLIIGNNVPALALAKELSKQHDIYIAPSCDIVEGFATGVDIREDNTKELLEFVLENDIDMTIPISNISLKTDLVSLFIQNQQQIFAPSPQAAEIANNKIFAKKIFYKLGIPTPKFGIFDK